MNVKLVISIHMSAIHKNLVKIDPVHSKIIGPIKKKEK